MKKALVILFFLPILSQSQNYNVASIPDSLKENANVVKRFEELRVIIKSPGKAIIKHKYALTILNEGGDKFAEYANNYSKMIDLSDISGSLYDGTGKKLKSVKKKDIADVSVEDGFSLALDDRTKRHDFYYRQYPYTVEYEDEQEFDGLYFLPYWEPVENEKYSVQQSSLIVEMPTDYKLRFKQNNYPSNPPAVVTDKELTYTWLINNVRAFKYEPLQPPYADVTTTVFLGVSDFSIGGYTGNMNTWADLGKFQSELIKGRDDLPENIKQDVHNLIDGVTDIHEKTRLLYQYMQNNTRYISVQLGIGGWQPFDAKYVGTKKYGDCKALSNFMVSLLKEAGIKANYVLVNAGSENIAKGLNESFPAPYFSHVIACVPTAKDTIWLECTNQTLPAGYIGDFTGNRKALLIDENGGHVVNTKRYTYNDNQDITFVSGEIDETGKLTAKITTSYSGFSYGEVHGRAASYSKEDQLKILKEGINLPTYDVTGFSYDDHKSETPSIDEHIQVVADGAATVSGKRLFFTPNFLTQSGGRIEESDHRAFPIEYNYDRTYIDSIQFKIPSGYSVEAMAKDVSIENKFGKYEIHFKVDGDKIFVVRRHQGSSGRYPPSEYNNLVKFYDDMYKADRSKIVFVKKGS